MSGVFSGTIVTLLGRIYKRKSRLQQRHVQNDYVYQLEQTVGSQSTTRFQSCWNVLHKLWRKILKRKRYRTFATWTAFILQISGVTSLVIILVVFNSEFNNNQWGVLISIPVVLILLSVVWCSAIQEYLNTLQNTPADGRRIASARWKNGILTNLWRIISLPTAAIIMSLIKFVNLEVDVDYLGKGLKQVRDDLSGDTFFLVTIFCTWGAYILSWFSCTTRMHTSGFVWPLLLATPVAVATTFGVCSNHKLKNELACEPEKYYEYGLLPISLILLWISQIICCVFYVWRTKLIALIKEENLFIQSYYNCPFTDQSLMLNRKTEFDDEKVRDPQKEALDSHVFVCTTMYHEKLHEQKQLLESIHRIDLEQGREKIRNFESHIFFDGGSKGCHITQFANQLFSLLEEMLKIKLSNGEKWETPYGLQIKWNLPGGMPFYVHLKDPHKVRKKKRWSQVMYMSYVLDFCCRKSNLNDDNTFILTTDADIEFDREAVEIILDLLCRDQLVGGVCGRVHPLGSGPIVWYQKFDYAVGHWFQKVSEHVLGSVMCCPGCFSVFRARALREVLPEYATKAEKAKEFLTKDMGEDRWLCTLMVEAGWRLEYAAAADSYTFCPDSFDEFYKQRRRWTPSTMANLIELCSNAKKVVENNDAISIIFIFYQAAMIFSTIIAPATVILLMAAGMSYAFHTSPHNDNSGEYIAFLVLFLLTSFAYGAVCIKCGQDTQLKMAKVLTFVFSIIMAVVVIGVIVQIANGFEGPETPTPSQLNSPSPTQSSKGISLTDVAVSTWYFGGLAAIFIIAGILHTTDVICLVHSLWYLLCLPSGYIFLIIFSICNLNDRSWGTREKVNQDPKDKDIWSVLRSFMDKLRYACGCCNCCHPPTLNESSQQNPQSPKDKKDGHENDNAEGNGNLSASSSSAQAESVNQAAPASKICCKL